MTGTRMPGGRTRSKHLFATPFCLRRADARYLLRQSANCGWLDLHLSHKLRPGGRPREIERWRWPRPHGLAESPRLIREVHERDLRESGPSFRPTPAFESEWRQRRLLLHRLEPHHRRLRRSLAVGDVTLTNHDHFEFAVAHAVRSPLASRSRSPSMVAARFECLTIEKDFAGRLAEVLSSHDGVDLKRVAEVGRICRAESGVLGREEHSALKRAASRRGLLLWDRMSAPSKLVCHRASVVRSKNASPKPRDARGRESGIASLRCRQNPGSTATLVRRLSAGRQTTATKPAQGGAETDARLFMRSERNVDLGRQSTSLSGIHRSTVTRASVLQKSQGRRRSAVRTVQR